MTRATFRKHERLSGREAVSTVIKGGKAVNASPFRLVGLLGALDTTAPAQVAFAVPKRHVKRATDRNRIRRLMREAYRLDKEQWYERLRASSVQCAWLFIYQGREPLGFLETRTKCAALMHRWLQQHLPQ